jgi:hypothetical protein
MTDDAAPIVHAIRGASGVDRYRISNRSGTYVKAITETGYLFTRDAAQAALFDRLSAISEPIVMASHRPSFYFDLVEK